MNIRAVPGTYTCAACGLVLEFLNRPDRATGDFEARCSNRWCDQHGETATLTAVLMRVASRNTLCTWPADAP